MEITQKSHTFIVTDLPGFVKGILAIPQENYSDIVSASLGFPDRFEYEHSAINFYIKEIFKDRKSEVLTWTNTQSFSAFLQQHNLADNPKFWFKTVYIKISGDRPFINHYTIHSYLIDLSRKFNLQFCHKDIIELRNFAIKSDKQLIEGKSDIQFEYRDFAFYVLKNFGESMGISICYKPRGMIITESFYKRYLQDIQDDLRIVRDMDFHGNSQQTMLKIPLNNFADNFTNVKKAVDSDLNGDKIGNKIYWENRHHMK